MKILKSLAAAAIAVASFVPVATASAASTTIDSIEVTVTPPTVGTTVGTTTCDSDGYEYECQDTTPTVTVASGANYSVSQSAYISGLPSETDEYYELFYGTFAADTNYYIGVNLVANDGYAFDMGLDEETYEAYDNMTLTVNEVEEYEKDEYNGYSSSYTFYARVQATSSSSSDSSSSSSSSDSSSSSSTLATYKTLNGAAQTFNADTDEDLTFRFNIDYDEFQESGEVYVDGELVSSDNYTTKSGSTIIIFNDDFTESLSAGNHTIKVATAYGSVSTTFTIKKSSNPKTGLNVISSFVLLGTSLAGLAGAAIYAKKANR